MSKTNLYISIMRRHVVKIAEELTTPLDQTEADLSRKLNKDGLTTKSVDDHTKVMDRLAEGQYRAGKYVGKKVFSKQLDRLDPVKNLAPNPPSTEVGKALTTGSKNLKDFHSFFSYEPEDEEPQIESNPYFNYGNKHMKDMFKTKKDVDMHMARTDAEPTGSMMTPARRQQAQEFLNSPYIKNIIDSEPARKAQQSADYGRNQLNSKLPKY
jgi:hypothetical protein